MVECGRLATEPKGEGERSNLLRGSNLLYGEARHNRFRKGRQPFNLTEYEWKGGRVVECGRLEICCTASRYREFESPPFRQKEHSGRGVFLLGKQWGRDGRQEFGGKQSADTMSARTVPNL